MFLGLEKQQRALTSNLHLLQPLSVDDCCCSAYYDSVPPSACLTILPSIACADVFFTANCMPLSLNIP
jgi:hypothetical protein